MGCFLACFSCSASKRTKSITSEEYHGLRSTELIQSIEQAKKEENLLTKLIRESKEEIEDQDRCGSKKRVTFDLNVKIYEEPSVTEIYGFDLLANNEVEREKSAKEETSKEMEPLFYANPLIEISGAKLNYRYRDCRNSIDERKDIGLNASDFDEEDGDIDVVGNEESSESLFSLSLDSRKQACDFETGENEVNSCPMAIRAVSKENVVKTIKLSEDIVKRSRFGDESVLNPIENLSQWKVEVKERPVTRHQKHEDKENNISLEPSLKRKCHNSKPKLIDETKLAQQEIGVDTSFSSWLIGSESKAKSKSGDSERENSPRCQKNAQLLGNSKIGEIKQSHGSLYLTRSRSQSSDVTPMIGTVGSYWVRTGQDLGSDTSSSLWRNANYT